jgi:hypothetical protein
MHLTIILKVISHLRGITLATHNNNIVIAGKIRFKKLKKMERGSRVKM